MISNFPILHLNDRSLRNKVDDLKLFLVNLHLKFTVIGIPNTAHRTILMMLICGIGYEFIHKNRPDRSGGVVGL